MIVDCHTHVSFAMDDVETSEHLQAAETVDACIVLAYTTGQDFAGAKVIFIDEQNKVAERMSYA